MNRSGWLFSPGMSRVGFVLNDFVFSVQYFMLSRHRAKHPATQIR